MVTVYDVSKLFFVNRLLGERYILDSSDPVLICQKNAEIASTIPGRADLVQAWTLASKASTILVANEQASILSATDYRNVDEDITWASDPCGRTLIESL